MIFFDRVLNHHGHDHGHEEHGHEHEHELGHEHEHGHKHHHGHENEHNEVEGSTSFPSHGMKEGLTAEEQDVENGIVLVQQNEVAPCSPGHLHEHEEGGKKCLEPFKEYEDEGHSHGPPKDATFSQAIMIVLALSVHSVFESCQAGCAKEPLEVWLLLIPIFAHKWAEAFIIGRQLERNNVKGWPALVLVGIFGLASPLGIYLGSAVSDTSYEWCLMTVSVGTMIYVGFTELAPEAYESKYFLRRLSAFFMMFFGIIFMAFLTVWEHEGKNWSWKKVFWYEQE